LICHGQYCQRNEEASKKSRAMRHIALAISPFRGGVARWRGASQLRHQFRKFEVVLRNFRRATPKNLRNQSTRPCASATSLVGSKVDKGVALEFRTTTCPLRFQYLAMRLNSSLAQRSQSPMTICRMSPASPRSLLFALACILEDPTHEERAEERSKPKSVRAVCCFPSL
jgi:hypothetical protein